MAQKIRPNEPCPCGSGRKYKKCCGAPVSLAQGVRHTQADRQSVFARMEAFVAGDPDWGQAWEEAQDTFWLEVDGWEDRWEELSEDIQLLSWDLEQGWLMFDFRRGDGLRAVDALLEAPGLSAGERSYLRAMAASTMRLWEVTGVVPGESITLRDLLEDQEVTVRERSGSLTISRGAWLAARVIPRGVSGAPELERGVVTLPRPECEELLEWVEDERAHFLEARPGAPLDGFYEDLPPLAHGVWFRSFFDPRLPHITNTDGEELVFTRTSFEVLDEAGLRQVLDAAGAEGIEKRDEAAWGWSSVPAESPESVSLGHLALEDGRLVVETNSVERGGRARALIERLAGDAVRHRGTTHKDPEAELKEALAKSRRRGGAEEAPGPAAAASGGLDPQVAEEAALKVLDAHYRKWVDEPIPALQGHTPREAARRPELVGEVRRLLRDLENDRDRARKAGRPAYDPSWMWEELGVERG